MKILNLSINDGLIDSPKLSSILTYDKVIKSVNLSLADDSSGAFTYMNNSGRTFRFVTNNIQAKDMNDFFRFARICEYRFKLDNKIKDETL